MTELIKFSEEQAMLLATAVDFCAEQSPVAKARPLLESEQAFDTGLWQQMVELGWMAITIPESEGGLGLGLAEVVPVLETMGRHLMVSPLVATTMATQALLRNGTAEQKALWLPKLASGTVATVALTEEDGNWNLNEVSACANADGKQWRLSGKKCFVLDATAADLIIVSLRIGNETRLVALTAAQLGASALTRETVIDNTRRSFRLNLDGITISDAQLLPGKDLRFLELAALLLQCAEIAGGLAGVLHITVEYMKTRKAFGRLIGSYQALKHPVVDILLEQEACRSHLYHAATVFAAGDLDASEIALRIAKAQGSDAFAYAGDRAVQFHGAMGFTWECDAQLYLRRALWCQYQYGDARHHRQLLAPLLLDK